MAFNVGRKLSDGGQSSNDTGPVFSSYLDSPSDKVDLALAKQRTSITP
jgi:hypothetical protein